MFIFNTSTDKKFRESIKYLERKSVAKLQINDNKAYLLNDVGFIISGSDIYQYTMNTDTKSNLVKNLYLMLIDTINLGI